MAGVQCFEYTATLSGVAPMVFITFGFAPWRRSVATHFREPPAAAAAKGGKYTGKKSPGPRDKTIRLPFGLAPCSIRSARIRGLHEGNPAAIKMYGLARCQRAVAGLPASRNCLTLSGLSFRMTRNNG